MKRARGRALHACIVPIKSAKSPGAAKGPRENIGPQIEPKQRRAGREPTTDCPCTHRTALDSNSYVESSVPNIHTPNIQVREHSRIFVEYSFGKWANILNIHEYSQNPSKSVDNMMIEPII